MKRLTAFITLFGIALSLPLAYLVWRTYQGLAQEERAQLNYFGETLLDQMEQELSALVVKEEARAVDEYQHRRIIPTSLPADTETELSPLARLPQEAFITGYLQNNPDGSFQTPLVDDRQAAPTSLDAIVEQLEHINQIFNRKRFTSEARFTEPVAPPKEGIEESKATAYAERYLRPSRLAKRKTRLGQRTERVEEITKDQALNIARQDRSPSLSETPLTRFRARSRSSTAAPAYETEAQAQAPSSADAPTAGPSTLRDVDKFQVEVAPLQSVFINAQNVFIFRRVVIQNQVYRQGFVLHLSPFMTHLAEQHFVPQPLSAFVGLKMQVWDQGQIRDIAQFGPSIDPVNLRIARTFPPPFDFLHAALLCQNIPHSQGRRTLNWVLALLTGIVVVGFVAILRSAHGVMALSEKRSQFVSSVTHELKTPLTNIRLYIEMLQEGIAADPAREKEYLRILSAESSRLTRLINNVLELSKLEQHKRPVEVQAGTLEEVLQEVEAMMRPRFDQEGFRFSVEREVVPPFLYDPEVMTLVLTNLIDNSLKFGRHAAEKLILLSIRQDAQRAVIRVSDRGPGIPPRALPNIFNEFYRADNSLTRNTSGTGIGLALVKKLTLAMGGDLNAANNAGPGCTITIYLPLANAHGRPAETR
jgi:signal transduction histidine kinase